MSDIIYGYFKVPTKKGDGFVCIRVDRPPKGHSGNCKASFSFCSPSDQFSRPLARRIANCRMESGHHFQFSTDSTKAADLFDRAIRLIPLNQPGWVTRALKKNSLYRHIRPRHLKREIRRETNFSV